MKTVYVQCVQCPDIALTATLHGDQMLVASKDGMESYTELNLYRLRRSIEASSTPKLHEALLIKAFCILTDTSQAHPKEGTNDLITYTNTSFTYTYKETDDE